MVGSGVVQERASVRGKEGSWWPGLMARDACGSCGAWLLGRPTLKLACRRGTPPPLHVQRPHHTSNLSTSLCRSLRGPLPPLSMEDVGKIQGRPLTEQSLGWAAIHTPPCAASRRCHLPALSPQGRVSGCLLHHLPRVLCGRTACGPGDGRQRTELGPRAHSCAVCFCFVTCPF